LKQCALFHLIIWSKKLKGYRFGKYDYGLNLVSYSKKSTAQVISCGSCRFYTVTTP
jgi:hypothetical protein